MTTTHTELIAQIRNLPEQVEALIAPYSPEQLSTPYHTGEWTLAQNVHHLVDAHIIVYLRCKLILTEENPLLKPWIPDAWAELPDGKTADIEDSMMMLRGLHRRWAAMFEAVSDWSRVGKHPVYGDLKLEYFLTNYAKHGQDHLAQMQAVIDHMPA